MSARWLLDLAALAHASNSVVQSHAALRAQQLAHFTRTSSIGIQVRSRATQLSTPIVPVRSSLSAAKASLGHGRPSAGPNRLIKEQETEQDHHYNASISNSAIDPAPTESLPLQQAGAHGETLPDGTSSGLKAASVVSHDLSPYAARRAQRSSEVQIPSRVAKGPSSLEDDCEGSSFRQDKDVFHEPSSDAGPLFSSLPRVKLPREGGDIQEGNGVVDTQGINPDVFYSPISEVTSLADSTPSPLQAPGQSSSEVSDENISQIFHSPRVAQMMQSENKQADINPYTSAVRRARADQSWPPKDRQAPIKDDQDVDIRELAKDIASVADQEKSGKSAALGEEMIPFQMRESQVPSSRFGRIWQYAGLGASMTMGAAAEGFRRMTGSESQPGASIMLSSANMERLVAKLSRMRGAALKLGQMLSFQDSKLLPPTIHQVLQRVQDSADYMPASQRDQVLRSNLGDNWRDLYSSFDEKPLAAASIGQVHGAVMKSTGERAVVKIQYPGVASSISSDLNNLSVLLNASRLLPKGLYLDKTIANARTELGWECDYIREAEAAKKFRQLLEDETDTFLVPKIYDEACGPQVITMQRMEGTAVTKCRDLSQEQMDWIGTQILRLCLREIVEFRFMQTDPNWTNFLYNGHTQKLELLDFGASRKFADSFVDSYTRILLAASRDDREACRDLSIKLGYLTGMESKAMLDAHIASVTTLAEPFKDTSPNVYDFRDQTITDRVREYIPVMLRERLAPPPEETYSLHRKLSGAFLLLARLGARVECKKLFADAMRKVDSM